MNICVFCGSSPGNDATYLTSATEVGASIAGSGHAVVYGGGRSGLMGAVADAALDAGGEVIGVIPQHLVDREMAHPGLTMLHVVGSMHERKFKMSSVSDAFIALPGGVGTWEELLEQWTWSKLGLHGKPVGLLNAKGYYDHLLAMISNAQRAGFVTTSDSRLLVVEGEIEALLNSMSIIENGALS